MREEEVASQVKKHSSEYFTAAVKSSGGISAEPARRQKVEVHVVTILDLRIDENRPSLTSGAVAEERQDVLSKNTIDEMADAITRGNDIRLWALWPANIPEKMREYWLKYETGSFWHCDEKPLFKHDVPQHRKHRNLSRKCTTSLVRRQNHNGEVVDRSWLCFSLSPTCVECFTCRLMSADTTKCAHFLIRKGISYWSTLMSPWGATSIQWNI